tara:strand:+ start:286 stop:1344 length:1059 start_codon:yes stop_codon:yes gene_type:complete
MLNLAIVGGGFYGCYLAKKFKDKLKSKISIDIFEKNNDLILEAGNNNQCKLHLGFHYPRSIFTIKQVVKGSKIFSNEFKKFVVFPKKNIYLIHKNSHVNFKKYYEIYKKLKVDIKKYDIRKIKFLKNYDDFNGAFNTKEGVIQFDKLNFFLIKYVKKKCNIFLNKKVIKIDSKKGIVFDQDKNPSKKYDYIINCNYTNPNLGLRKKFKLKYEFAGMVKFYNPFKEMVGVTIMDGQFVTLYPRNKLFSSLSSVKCTPIKRFKKLKDLYKFQSKFNLNKNNRIKLIIDDVRNYFSKKLVIEKPVLITSPKTKVYNDNKDQRPTLIRRHKKTFSILAGKIDVAPLIFEALIKKII